MSSSQLPAADACPHPELDRMLKAIPDHLTQEVGAFIDWLVNTKGYKICEYIGETTHPEQPTWSVPMYQPVQKPVDQWLAEMHGIDLQKVDEERRMILQRQRLLNAAARLEEDDAD